MTLSRSVVSASILAAVGLLGLSACSGEKPSGIAPFTPAASTAAATPSPTVTSKWTAEQQQVIDGYDRFNTVITAILSKAEKIDMVKVRRVAKEPYATTYLKRIDATVSAGFVQTGKLVTTISAVSVAGKKATIKVCEDQTRKRVTNPSNPTAPKVQIFPPALATVSLIREGDVWKVAGFKGDEGVCVSG